MNRRQRRETAQSTLAILRSGRLTSHDNHNSENEQKSLEDISNWIQASVEGTRSYPEDAAIPEPLPKAGATQTEIQVINTTTLEAAHALYHLEQHEPPAVLNFASAKNPGGGFLNGSLAQEESLANHSALYACLEHDPMYSFHRPLKGGKYTEGRCKFDHMTVIRCDYL